MPPLVVIVPGEPVSQGRPRFARMGKFVRAYDPEKSRSWKGAAREAMTTARNSDALPFPDGALEVEVLAVFTCPKGDWRKSKPTPRRNHAKRPDAENVAKAVLDSATSVLWRDDSQVARLVIVKVIGAQGEAPFVRLAVREMDPDPKVEQPELFR